MVSSTVFSSLGDTANYTPLTGGTFEGDMSGWTLNSASVAPGNEPWQVDGAGDSRSLSIASGGTAVSPTFCVSSKTPTWRFFAHAADASPDTVLHVSAQVVTPGGHVIQVPLTNLSGSGYSSWAATPAMVRMGCASILGQCSFYRLGESLLSKIQQGPTSNLGPDQVEALAEHVTRFAVAGLKACGARVPPASFPGVSTAQAGRPHHKGKWS